MIYIFRLGGVFGEWFRNSNGIVKCLNTLPIKLRLGPIFESILEVEKRVLIGHVAYLEQKSSELVDVAPDSTRLFEAT